MLTQCPECNLQISDKAIMCPHCGYPLKPEKISRSKKRKRLPNGFGQISEIKGHNLRKPFRAMVTVGKTQTGRPICKPLKPESYFETYNDAYAALVEYNRKPYELEKSITVKELFERWSPTYIEKKKFKNTIQTFYNTWQYCSSVYDLQVKELRVRHIKYCMEEGLAVIKGVEQKPSPIVQTRIKSLFNLMLDYALEYELVDKNVARTFKISSDLIHTIGQVKNGHIPYSEEEISLLWDNVDYPGVDILLIQCYSGWRPRELCELKISDVNLEEGSMRGGMKTVAGTNRLVPIHSKIMPLVKRRYDEATENELEYLFNVNRPDGWGNVTTYNYTYLIEKLVKKFNLDPNHRPHDGRKHFVTEAKKYNVDEYAIKYIVGHVINDLTESTYTERTFEWLKEEMQKIR